MAPTMTDRPPHVPPGPRAPRGLDRCFSLVELVIVVVIIGIIAAIAIPRITKGAAASGEAALKQTLKVLRDSIDRYSSEHGGDFPAARPDPSAGHGANTEGAFETQLTRYSDAAGATSATASSSYPFGPYLRVIPELSVSSKKGAKGVVIDGTNSPPLVTSATKAWVYNPYTGEIIANSDDANADGSRAYDEY
jgi:general secretion pathway protein G